MQENELWDKESNHSIGSWAPPNKLKNDGYAESRTSVYGRETVYDAGFAQRTFSPSPSQHGGMGFGAPPGYQSGRNTPLGGYGYGAPQMPHARTTSMAMSDSGPLYQPAPSRPTTNYLDMPIVSSQSPVQLGDFGLGPSDADIEVAVDDILRDADLNTVTKREIRRRLEEQFQTDLSSRKSTVNAAIDRALMTKSGMQ